MPVTCTADAPAPSVCVAQKAGNRVAVSLPATAGAVSPPNTASTLPLQTFTYSPPVPTITLVNRAAMSSLAAVPTLEWAAREALNQLEFAVNFSSPVQGLIAGDFRIDTRCSRAACDLIGANATYSLTVTLWPTADCECGEGQVRLTGVEPATCAYVRYARSMADADVECGKDGVAMLDSAMTAVGGGVVEMLAGAGYSSAWYTCTDGACSLPVPCTAWCTGVDGAYASFPRVRTCEAGATERVNCGSPFVAWLHTAGGGARSAAYR